MVKSTKKAFTLAEVLTTLMVIGVVAAMTIPTLLNSTNDQQLRVAYKKGMSILSQGIQLMIAKEEECYVMDGDTLANCMQNAIAGTIYKVDGEDKLELAATENKNFGEGNGAVQRAFKAGNVIVTNDGISYAFYYKPGDDDTKVKRNLDDICGSASEMFLSTADSWNGSTSKCVVIVDMNGPSKGTHGFKKGSDDDDDVAGKDISGDSIAGSDQMALLMSGGGVRPLYAKAGAEDGAEDKAKIFNKGYAWVYGDNAGQPFADD